MSSLSVLQLLLLLLRLPIAWAFPAQRYVRQRHARPAAASSTTAFPPYVPAEAVQEIQEEAALDMLRSLQRVDVTVGFNGGVVPSSFYHKESSSSSSAAAASASSSDEPVVVLLHGFDSSCLEYRRLVPCLEERGLAPYALDVLGWGFTDTRAFGDTSAAAKRAHLHAFWQQQLGGRPLVLVGASLGGAIAIDFAAAFPGAVQRLVLIDAQGFIDGAGPMGGFPRPVARWGIKLLGSKPLRNLANQLSYSDPDAFATEDAMLVGRLPVVCDGWEDSNLEYMCTGGFTPSEKVPLVDCPTLVLWGRDDKILDPALYAQRFVDEMPDAKLTYVDQCGHVPHLEKPEVAADAIAEFLGDFLAGAGEGTGAAQAQTEGTAAAAAPPPPPPPPAGGEEN